MLFLRPGPADPVDHELLADPFDQLGGDQHVRRDLGPDARPRYELSDIPLLIDQNIHLASRLVFARHSIFQFVPLRLAFHGFDDLSIRSP